MLHRAARGWMYFAKGSDKVRGWVKYDGVGRWETVTGNQGWRIIARRLVLSRKDLDLSLSEVWEGRAMLCMYPGVL